MTRPPSRPSFLIAGVLVFLLLPLLYPLWSGEAVRPRWMGFGAVLALYFLYMAYDSRKRLRGMGTREQRSE